MSPTGSIDRVDAALFLVERRMPAITDNELSMLRSILADATRRFVGHDQHVSHIRSIFLPAQGRCLSLFRASSVEIVRAVNESTLIPFVSIEPAFEILNSV